MEYVCRVGTPSGEVVERTVSASDERALRAELKQQGFYLLSMRQGLSLSMLRIRGGA
jgi:type II secretory pathway component PulF